jgi:outer membrane receptor protein involved in Fe transport
VDQSSLVDTYGSIATSVTSSTTLGGVRATWRSVVATWLTAEAGVDAEIQQSSLQRIGSTLDPPREGDPYVFGEPPPNQLNSDKWKVFFVDVAPYVELDFQPVPKTLHITPGLRFDPYARTVSEAFPTTAGEPATGLDQQNFSFEPRLSVRWDANSRLSLHAAVGRYNEMPAAGDLSAVFGNPTLPTSSATQALAGVAGKITEKLSLEATGFWSNSWDLAVRNPVAAPAAAQALVSHGFGRAYGGQFVLRQEKIGPFFGWVSYTLSRSERQDVPHGPWRLSDYDQTHLLTAVADCDVLWGIDVGLRMRYATGFPRTPVTGAYFDAQLDQYEPVFGAINAVRIPAFFQVDLRIAKAWKIGRSKLDLSLDIQNVTNQANAEEIAYSSDFTRKSYITGLPILPVLGLKWSI